MQEENQPTDGSLSLNPYLKRAKKTYDGMLTEQKQYLSPLYTLLNRIAAILFCVISLIMGQYVFAFQIWLWIFCYLLPVLLLLAIIPKKIWHNMPQPGFSKLRIWIAVPAVALCLAIAIWVIFFGISTATSGDTSHLNLPDNIRYSIFFISLGYGFSAMMLMVFRWHLVRKIKRGTINNKLIKSVIMVGTDESAKPVARAIGAHPEWGMRIAGYLTVDPNDVKKSFGSHCILGTPDSLGNILLTHVVDMVLIASDRIDKSHVDTIVRRCHLEGVDIGFAVGQHEVKEAFLIQEHLDDLNLKIFKFVYQQPERLFYKRIFDLSLSFAIICFLFPVWMVLPLLIRLESRGPIFLREDRFTKGGRLFTVFKFRSIMVDDGKKPKELMHPVDMDYSVFKIKENPRLTHMGRFLCKTGLDGLPQLFNVVKGDMSLVGPRPALYDDVCQYRPLEKKRLSVMPGITGFWQVCDRNEIHADEWRKLDLLYIREWSFALDLMILLKAPFAVIAGKGNRASSYLIRGGN